MKASQLVKPFRYSFVHNGKAGESTAYATRANFNRYGMRSVPTNARRIRVVISR